MYIDPNTGGMLFQVLATLLAVFSGMALIFSSKIRSFFARIRRSQRGETNDTESSLPEDSSISSSPPQDADPEN